MNASRTKSRFRQQGMVTVLAVIFLITGVIFVLSQTLNITGSNSIDNSRQMDSTAALFLAESGIERGQYTLVKGDEVTSDWCSGITAGPLSLGDRGGSFTITGTSSPPQCGGTNPAICQSCLITSTGKVGNSSRTIERNISLASKYGTAGYGQYASMTLSNKTSTPALALFVLSMRRNGNETDALCTGLSTSGIPVDCIMQWNVQSQNGGGTGSAGGMGVSVVIGGNDSATITQTLSSVRTYSEVGVLLPSADGEAAPGLVGSYWNDKAGKQWAVGKYGGSASTSSGQTSNGDASSSCALTLASSPVPNSGSAQAGDCWCRAANTMLFGYSGRAWDDPKTAALNNALTRVVFGPMNYPLTRLAKYANNDNPLDPVISDTTFDASAFAEIWYAQNQDFLTNSAAWAGGTGTGTVGAKFTGSIASNTLTVTNITTGGNFGALFTGDTFTSGATGKIGIGSCTGSPPTMTCPVDTAQAVPSGTTITTSSSVLTATISSGGWAIGDTLSFGSTAPFLGTTTIISPARTGVLGNTGTYNLSAANYFNGSITALSPTVYTSLATPSLAIGSLVRVRSGNGKIFASATGSITGTILTVTTVGSGRLAVGDRLVDANGAIGSGTTITAYGTGTGGAGTYTISSSQTVASTSFAIWRTVTAVAINSFTLSAPTSTVLSAAEVCGGMCALFDSSSETGFSITRNTPGGQADWTSGFLCASGAGKPQVVSSVLVRPGVWHEQVR